MTKTTSENKCYIGIDVSKATLDVYLSITNKHFKVPNTLAGFKQINKCVMKHQPEMIALEPTSKYHRAVTKYLLEKNYNVSVVNAYRARRFAESLGLLSKTDKVDAQALAKYAEKGELKKSEISSKESELLSDLISRRRQLTKMRTQETNHLECAGKVVARSIKTMLKSIEKQLESIDEEIEKIVLADPDLQEKKAIMESVKGISHKTSTTLLALLPELGQLSSKKISALVGLAPYDNSSGNRDGKRCIRGGRADVRTALYMSAIVGLQYNPRIKAFYHHLLANGKVKKSAITACMHKLLIILNAMIKNQEMWDDDRYKLSPAS